MPELLSADSLMPEWDVPDWPTGYCSYDDLIQVLGPSASDTKHKWTANASSNVTMAPATLERDLIRRILSQYAVVDGPSVECYVAENPVVLEILAEAKQAVDQSFGLGTPVLVNLQADMETDGDPVLQAYIQTPEPYEVVKAKLAHFDENWWDAALSNSRGLIVFNVNYIAAN